MYNYTAYGVNFVSGIELPELFPGHDRADVEISFARLNVRCPSRPHASWLGYDEAVYLYWEDVAVFRVYRGCQIEIDPVSGASPERIRLFLLGAALGLLLIQRNQLVVHASAVALPDGAVAFLGDKGLGKSTTAAFLQSRGHRLITDDVLAVDLNRTPFRVYSGLRQLKLWPDALAAMGRNADHYARLHPQFEKRDYPTEPFEPELYPLKAAYALGFGDEARIEKYSPREAFLNLLANWYGTRFDPEVRQFISQEKVLKQCAAFVSQIPIFALERPPELHYQWAAAELVEGHSRDLYSRTTR